MTLSSIPQKFQCYFILNNCQWLKTLNAQFKYLCFLLLRHHHHLRHHHRHRQKTHLNHLHQEYLSNNKMITCVNNYLSTESEVFMGKSTGFFSYVCHEILLNKTMQLLTFLQYSYTTSNNNTASHTTTVLILLSLKLQK